jgi:glycosyltransferase involved in cell wall biosynthesis
MTFFLYFFWYDRRFRKAIGGPMKVFELADNLKSLGHEVFLFTPKVGCPEKQTSVKTIQMPVLGIPILGTLLYEVMLFFCSLYILLKKKCDIIYVRRMTSLIPLFISALSRSPMVIEINDNPYRHYGRLNIGGNSSVKVLITRLVDKANHRLCKKICAVTDKVKLEMQEVDKIPEDKIVVTRSGANTELFLPMDKRECRLSLGLDPDKKYVGFVGNYVEVDDYDSIINSASIVVKQFPDVRYLIVGNGRWKTNELPKIRKKNLTEYFILCGYIPYKNVPRYINSSDICLSPFMKFCEESSGVKIFDYLSCARPVITSKIGSTADYLLDGNCAVLVPLEDPQALTEAIINLLSNQRKMEEMGQNGRKFIVEKYSRKLIAKKVVEIAEQIGYQKTLLRRI